MKSVISALIVTATLVQFTLPLGVNVIVGPDKSIAVPENCNAPLSKFAPRDEPAKSMAVAAINSPELSDNEDPVGVNALATLPWAVASISSLKVLASPCINRL